MKKESNSVFDTRMKLGITQQTMAELLGVAKNYVYLMEAGRKPITETIEKKLVKLDAVKFTSKKVAFQTNREGVIPGSLSMQDNSGGYMSLPDGPCKNCSLLQAELEAVKEQLHRQNAVIDLFVTKGKVQP